MTTIYFPFTLLDARAAEDWADLLGPLTLCSPYGRPPGDPLAALASRGLVRWCTPAGVDDRQLRSAVAECLDWGRQQRGGERAFLKAQRDRVPLAVAETPREIASRIRGGGPSPPDPMEERLRRARIFLALAEVLDAQEREVAAALGQVEHRERDMFQILRADAGDDFSAPPEAAGPAPEAPRLLADRLQAWGVLAGALLEGIREPETLLVTDHQGAFELARERLTPEAARPRWLPWPPRGEVPRGIDWLAAEWARGAGADRPAASGEGRGLAVVRLDDPLPERLFDRLAGLGTQGRGSSPGTRGGGYLAWISGPCP